MKNLFWVVGFASTLLMCGCGFEERVPAQMISMDQSQPVGKEKSLSAEIRFDIGSLEVTGDNRPNLYAMDLEYDKASYEPESHYDTGEEGRFSFRLHSIHRAGLHSDHQSNRLRLNLTDSIPVKLNVNTGVGDTRLNLSGLKVERLEIEAGVGASKLSAYEPNSIDCETVRIKNGVGSMDAVGLGNLNFRDFDFEGGVGGANLDFTGDWRHGADVRIQVGVGGVTMKVPRDVGVRVEAEKHFLSGLHLDGFSQRDSYYYSTNYDNAKIRLSVRVVTGVGGFRITWV